MRGAQFFYYFGVLKYVVMIENLWQRSRLRVFTTPSLITDPQRRKRRAGLHPLALDTENCIVSGSFYHCAGPDATGAHLGLLLVAAGSHHANHFQVWQPAPSGFVVRMRNIVSHDRSLATKFTYFSHCFLPLSHSPPPGRSTGQFLKYIVMSDY